MWPDWGIFCTLGNFFKPLGIINLPKSLTLLGNFRKGVKILNFSCEIIFGQLLQTFGDFYLVTLLPTIFCPNNFAEQIEASAEIFNHPFSLHFDLCELEGESENVQRCGMRRRKKEWNVGPSFKGCVPKRERERETEESKSCDWIVTGLEMISVSIINN